MKVERREYVGALRAGRKERRVQIGKLSDLRSLYQSKIKHQCKNRKGQEDCGITGWVPVFNERSNAAFVFLLTHL